MEFRTSIPRTLGVVGLGVLMIALCYYLARTGVGDDVREVGWLGVAFFGLALVGWLSQLLRRGPTVTIDDRGVFDRRMGIGPILWRDIAFISIGQVRRERFMSLWLRNEDQYLSKAPRVKRGLELASRELGFSPFTLSFIGLTPGIDEAYALLRQRIPERAGV